MPSDSFLVELSWDSEVGDIDLHLVKQSDEGKFCGDQTGDLSEACADVGSDLTCYFGNCNVGFPEGTKPDWDESGSGQTAGDASLDIDDLCGHGPENINIDQATAGEYLVGVHFFGFTGCEGQGPIDMTVRVYIEGDLEGTFVKTLDPYDWWEVAVIEWPAPGAGSPCVEDLATPASECP